MAAMPLCPQCNAKHVRRSHRANLLEHVLSRCFVYPFRCEICRHRFLALQWGARYNRQTIDPRREYQRVETHLPVIFRGDVAGEGEMTEISRNGCTVKTDIRLAAGTVLPIELQLSYRDLTVSVQTAIVRTVRDDGALGLQFLRLSPQDQEHLQEFVQDLIEERP
jgi:hypothetical protein